MKTTNWSAKSDAFLARAHDEVLGYIRAGVEGYEETLREIEAELKKREII